MKEGDVDLLKDSQAHRNDWPNGLGVKAILSSDGMKGGGVDCKGCKVKVFPRPISEVVVILSEMQKKPL